MTPCSARRQLPVVGSDVEPGWVDLVVMPSDEVPRRREVRRWTDGGAPVIGIALEIARPTRRADRPDGAAGPLDDPARQVQAAAPPKLDLAVLSRRGAARVVLHAEVVEREHDRVDELVFGVVV